MAMFWIFTTSKNNADRQIQFAFEGDYNSVQDMADDLAEGLMITGHRIEQVKGPDGLYVERARRQVALNAAHVAMIEEYDTRRAVAR